MANYAGGTKFEYVVRDYFKGRGFEVMRAAGSKGAVDLMAWNGKDVFLIQCKKEKKKNSSFREDVERMRGVATQPRWKRQLWVKRGKNVMVHDIDKGTKYDVLFAFIRRKKDAD